MNEIMFYGGIAGAIIFGLVAVILFIHFHIYTVIGDITGLNAKRSIAKLQQEGYAGGVSKEEAINAETAEIHARRGKTTAKLPQSKSGALKKTHKLQKTGDETTLLNNPISEVTTILQGSEATTVLQGMTGSEATTVLSGTGNVAPVASETTVLMGNQTGFIFDIVQSEQIIHTAEHI